jgi:hypothetical protein
MSKQPIWGGRREGAGRPRVSGPTFYHGETLIMEREEIGGEISKPQWVRVIGVGENELELQPDGTNEIIVIRRELPDDEEE